MSIGTAHIVGINAYVAGAYSSLSHGSRKLLSVVKLPSSESGRESWLIAVGHFVDTSRGTPFPSEASMIC
jgi:hypothetical protein